MISANVRRLRSIKSKDRLKRIELSLQTMLVYGLSITGAVFLYYFIIKGLISLFS